MPDPVPPERAETIVKGGFRLGSQVVTSLAPQFLALLLVNCIFLGILFWYIDARARYASAFINQLMDACLRR